MASSEQQIRNYDAATDLKAVQRIWLEVGWIEDEDGEKKLLSDFLSVGDTLVACIDGEPECAVHTTPGELRYLTADLPLCAVTAVTTSRIGRRLGFAGRLTAQALMNGAREGAAIAALGMFDQGFYDKVGFGSGSYEHEFLFDPSTLNVPATYRTPARLTADDWPKMRDAMVDRKRSHGNVVLSPPKIMKAELGWIENFFGLGYHDGERLTHFIAGEAKGEHGPYSIIWIAYQSTDQLMELLALVHALGDQVSTFRMVEPPEIQLQDLLKVPFRQRRNTRGSAQENRHRTDAYWQVRMLDVPVCFAKTQLPWTSLQFNLTVTDPVSTRDDVDWPGVAGEYTVTLGEASSATTGHAKGLRHLKTSVGALTRLWLGVRDATALALTDDLRGPADLLADLDLAFRLPRPTMTWDF